MANNYTLTAEDRLRWERRAPRASYWLGVSDTHPFINGGRPAGATTITPLPMMIPPPPMMLPPLPPIMLPPPPPMMVPPPPPTMVPPSPMMIARPMARNAPPPPMIAPPPPYTQALSAPRVPTFQPYLHGGQPDFTIPGVVHPGVVQFPPANPVPVYDVRNHNSTGLDVVGENACSSLPPCKSQPIQLCCY